MSNDRPDFTWEEFASGKEPPGGPAPRDSDRFKPCFRHPDRSTGISCQHCDRPICGECMRPASVGFHCPVCVADARSTARPVRAPRRPRLSAFALPGTGGAVSTTIALMVLTGAVGIVDLVTNGLAGGLLAFSGPLILLGEFWRLVTSILVTGGLFNLLIHLFFLYFVGRSVETEIGRWRMLALLLLSGLGASTALLWLLPQTAQWPLAFPAVLGMLGGVAVLKLRGGEDIRGDLILLGLMVAFSFLAGSPAGWIGDLGGIALGAAAGGVLAYVPRRRGSSAQTLGLVGLAAGCLALCLLRLAV